MLSLLLCSSAFAKPSKQVANLTPEGEKALAEYSGMLEALRDELKPSLPMIDQKQAAALLAAHQKPKNPELVELDAAKPILTQLDGFLANGSLDTKFAKCVVLANATPRGLAEFAQQGPEKKKLIDDLLSDPDLMLQIILSGGAKAGRYGKAMELYRAIQASSDRSKSGHFQRLALATALELAAPELCGYDNIDPVKRYAFYEKSYLDKELDSHFDQHTVWLYRQVINDPHSEVDMKWMRQMLWNYRPDFITVPESFQSRYVGLMNSEFGHKAPEFVDGAETSQIQQTIDRGSLCGPKAFFGRCLGRSFGIPVWGARLRSHTAMTYWTPKGWTQILGVSWQNGYWVVDEPEKMRAHYFRLQQIARDFPDEFIKACRAQWIGDVLGEKKVDGMDLNTGDLWNVVALNKERSIAMQANPPADKKAPLPWVANVYLKTDPKNPEQIMTPVIADADRKVAIDDKGVIVIPAAACTSPTANTQKIVFMKGRDGSMQLHYKRWEQPEPFTYEVTAPAAGKYAMSANVVTVNREQFFLATVNGGKDQLEFKMPYTVGMWGESEPLVVSLNKGINTLSFTRTVPGDFEKEGYKFAGPQFGGVTIKSFTLKPVK